MIATVFNMLAANRVAFRRARNLRAAGRGHVRAERSRARAQGLSAERLVALAALLCGLAGAVMIGAHARLLAQESEALEGGTNLDVLQPLLPGLSFEVPAQPGVTVERGERATLLIAAGMQPQGQAQVDLCAQMLEGPHPRLLPVRIGYPFSEVARLAESSQAPLRAVVLAPGGSTLPRIEIGGTRSAGFANRLDQALAVVWSSGTGETSWVGDTGPQGVVTGEQGNGLLRQEGWLVLGSQEALRVRRRPSQACPQAGELVIELYRQAAREGKRALVTAFPFAGKPVALRLPPGAYSVPVSAPPVQEDRALFGQLKAYGLVRLGPDGLAELAPPDLAAWRAASESERVTDLHGWDGPPLTAQERDLLDRLYHKADGDYVREQVRIFNAEQRLFAVRLRKGLAGARWRASADGVPVTLTDSMPAGATRLFERFPQGWGPWQRAAAWAGNEPAHVTLELPASAQREATLELLAAGRVTVLRGASLRDREPACTGRGCPSPDAVERLVLDLRPGARRITFAAAPMDAAGLTDPQYRHLRVARGQLEWQVLPRPASSQQAPLAQVVLADRNGAPLWNGGKATRAAIGAGLGPLLGLHPGHVNSVAGMLARLPAPAGKPHVAGLTLDLGLQASAQAALDCIGMRRGRLEGGGCSGGSAAPRGREAGFVLLDADTGDILAAAGAGSPTVDDGNWDEVLDFDRADPAASPLRLPAFQHDGGSRRSPGSTFKIISSLGLELAARRDPQLDAMLDGLPLASLDRIALATGFPFRSDAGTYPAQTSRAHITNFHGELPTRFVDDGRFGLVQAMTHSVNSWFAFTSELSDRSLLGQPEGGVPALQALDPAVLGDVRPIAAMAARLGFGQALRLDGGLLPADYPWSTWDALQATPSHIDPIRSRHELRQMAIGLRMQATPLQMALAAGAVGEGRVIVPRLLYQLDGRTAPAQAGPALDVRLDRIRSGMKGVVDRGTAASAFRGAAFNRMRAGLFGKTGTSLTGEVDAKGRELATVWFAGWIEPGSIPGQTRRLAFAAFVSRSEGTGGEHAAPVIASVLRSLQDRAGKPRI